MQILTLLLFFLSPPKNLLIWSMRPGFFFFLPSPKVLCPEVLAVAMLAVAGVGWGWPLTIYSVVLFQAGPQCQHASLLLLQRGLQLFWRAGAVFEGVILSVPGHHGTWGGSGGGGAGRSAVGAAARSVVLARLQAFFGASVAVSVTAALCMGPSIVPHPICLTPAAGTTRVISESALTPWWKAARRTVRPLLSRPHIFS